MRRVREERRGVAAVEFAATLPLLLVLLLGAWEVGRMVEVKQLLAYAAREGGRQASTGNMTAAEVKSYVAQCLQLNGLSAVTADNVTVTNLTGGSDVDPTQAEQLDEFEVVVTIPFDSVRWILADRVTSVTTLTASAVWNSMRDIPVTVNTTIPLN